MIPLKRKCKDIFVEANNLSEIWCFENIGKYDLLCYVNPFFSNMLKFSQQQKNKMIYCMAIKEVHAEIIGDNQFNDQPRPIFISLSI